MVFVFQCTLRSQYFTDDYLTAETALLPTLITGVAMPPRGPTGAPLLPHSSPMHTRGGVGQPTARGPAAARGELKLACTLQAWVSRSTQKLFVAGRNRRVRRSCEE